MRIRHHPLFLPLYAPAVIIAFCQGLLAPVLPLYAASFEVSYGLVGLLLAGAGLGRLMGDVPAGILLRRFGTKWMMVAGFGGILLSTVALFWARSVPEALFYRLITGFSMALYATARHLYTANVIKLASRGRSLALLGGVNRIGRFAGPAVGGLVAGLALRAPFLVYGVFGVVSLIFMVVFIPATEMNTHTPAAKRGQFRTVLRSKAGVLTSAGTGQLFAQMIRVGRHAIIPLYATDVIGLDVEVIGFIVSAAGLVEMSLFYPAGLLMDRLGRKYAIVPTFLLQAIGMFLVPFTSGFFGLLFATSLMGFANGLSAGTMMTLGADLSPQRGRGEFLGVWRLIGDVGASGSPLIVGGIADWLALGPAAWVLAGAGLLAATTFAFFVPETLEKPPA